MGKVEMIPISEVDAYIRKELILEVPALASFPVHLTPAEQNLLAVLLRYKGIVTTQAMLIACSESSPDDLSSNLASVRISHLRKKLRPFGITIETDWGVGAHITDENRAKVRALAGGC